jgi:hypothetical protein
MDLHSEAVEEASYRECLAMAESHGWWGVYFAMLEDGFDAEVDWTGMLNLWKLQQAEEGKS